MPLGSCAHALIHHATLPTLVVRMRMIDKETQADTMIVMGSQGRGRIPEHLWAA
jgi:nucleotide-binding universal stress UspA family protein